MVAGSQVELMLDEWARNRQRAVILDFNGTLSDDEPILLQIYAEMFLERFGWNLTEEEYRTDLLGHSDREIIERIAARHASGDEALVEQMLAVRRERYREIVAHASPISEDALGFLRRLKTAQVPVAIVTGAERGDVTAVLENCEAGKLVDLLIGLEDVRRGKPDPEGFLQAAQRMGRMPGDMLVFEDSLPGVRGAEAAGMCCIAVTGDAAPPGLAEAASASIARLSPDVWAHLSPVVVPET